MKTKSFVIALILFITYSCTRDSTPDFKDQSQTNKDNEIHFCSEISLPNSELDNSNNKGAIDKFKKWTTGQTITVKFLNGDAFLQQKVKQFACQWMIYANLKIMFVEPWQNADIKVGFKWNGDTGSYSQLGTNCQKIDQNNISMNFGWFDSYTSDTEFSRTVIHEFGHALGLIHEHQQPLANIPWNLDALYNYHNGSLTREQVDQNIVRKYNTNQTNYSTYDNLSIMHYAIPPGLTTNGYSVGWNTSLSNIDKIFIEQMYLGAPDQYLVGDWDGDGIDNLGIRRGNVIILDFNNDGIADYTFAYGNGSSESEYLVGDWNGDGRDNIAVRRGNQIIMDYNFDGGGDADFRYGNGNSESEYLVGDWNGDGKDNIAVRRDNQIIMDYNFDGGGDADFRYGNGNSESGYLVGDWNGDGKDNIAVRRDNQIIMDYNFDGGGDADFRYGNGSSESEYLVGDWNRDRKDNIAVRRKNQIILDYNFDGAGDADFKIGN
jgi:hypothetical protein